MACPRLYPNLPALKDKSPAPLAADQEQSPTMTTPGEKAQLCMPHVVASRPQPVIVLPPPYAEVPSPLYTEAPPPYSRLDVMCASPKLGEAFLLVGEPAYNQQSRADKSYTASYEAQTSSTVNKSAYAHLPPTHELDTDESDVVNHLVLQRMQAYAY